MLPAPESTQDFQAAYPDFSEGVAKVSRALERGDLFLDYLPLRYEVAGSYACNLKCVMCVQSDSCNSEMLSPYSVDGFMEAVKEIGGSNIGELAIVGGEPFANKDSLELIDFCSDPMFKNTTITIVTNGLNVDKHLDAIKNIEKLRITLSIEGTREAYESIRVGSNWNRVTDNYKQLLALEKEKDGLMLEHVMSIIMRSSIPSLKELVEFFVECRGRLHFVRCCSAFYFENVFLYPSLLEGINWERHMLDAIHVAAQYGLDSEINFLTSMLRDLKQRASRPNQDVLRQEFDRIVRLCNSDFEPWQVHGRNKKEKISNEKIIETCENFFAWLKKCNLEIDENSALYFRQRLQELKERNDSFTKDLGINQSIQVSLSTRTL
ncbi:MAG: radical SAM protein [Deltaproteobacteria bacterium]|nr:radical SAM protein [Deltaproteobacteria bacterium]